MANFHAKTVMPCDARTLYDWHARPGALERLTPPWQSVRIAERKPGSDHPRIGNGAIAKLMVGVGPMGLPWVAEHFDHEPPHQFCDRQLAGPFGSWTHTHTFNELGEHRSELEDSIEYAPPAGPLGSMFLGGKLAGDLERLFWFRHERTRADLERHARASEPMTVAIAGSSGMIGSALAAFLATGGHRVIRLVRRPADTNPTDGIEQRRWEPGSHDISPGMLADVDAVVNLCGDNIAAGRWTDRRKKQLESSRVGPTATLASAIAALPSADRPRVLINASGVHAYGDGGDEPLTEASERGHGYLPTLVKKWEAATRPAQAVGVRVVHARFGMVLGASGGALKSLLTPAKLGLAGPIGTGRQWWPWIGLDDAIGALHYLLTQSTVDGPVNVCAPNAATANDVMSAIAQAVRRPAAIGLPAVAARTLLGHEMADESLLSSTRAEPAALERAGFRWMHPTLMDAVGWELGVRRLVDSSSSASTPVIAGTA
ncbi:MAG: TIGR01777 family oxidoreductase [Phycisphaerales bacterium JB064]